MPKSLSAQELFINYRLASIAFLNEPCAEKRKWLAHCLHQLNVGLVIAGV